MNKKEHIQYWLDSANHDLETAETLFVAKKFDWCLFIGHLVLEKALKAIFVNDNNNKVPPTIHNLLKLSELTNLSLILEQKKFLDKVNEFNLETRYPDFRLIFYKICDEKFAELYFSKIKEFYSWLKSQLRY